jgi:hypothetical protein
LYKRGIVTAATAIPIAIFKRDELDFVCYTTTGLS